MKVEQMIQLIDAMSKSGLTEFKYEEDGVKLSLKKTSGQPVVVQQAFPALDAQAALNQIPAQPYMVSAPAAAGIQAAGTVVSGVAADVNTAGAQTASAPVQTETQQGTDGEKAAQGGNIVKSPLVGTFYAAPSEEAEPFVKVGDSVKEGQVLAIVEAMKLMNEIESDFSGTVAEILVENGEAVEYGQPLFVIR